MYNPTLARGYYLAADEIINWMNSTDSSRWDVHRFRSELNMKLLSMRPDKYLYKQGTDNEDSVDL